MASPGSDDHHQVEELIVDGISCLVTQVAGVRIVMYGTAHVSQRSKEEARRLVSTIQPSLSSTSTKQQQPCLHPSVCVFLASFVPFDSLQCTRSRMVTPMASLLLSKLATQHWCLWSCAKSVRLSCARTPTTHSRLSSQTLPLRK